MAGSGRKWLQGCGIGCGLMLVILIGMGSCAYLGVKRIERRADQIGASSSVLAEQFGQVNDFCPPGDGVITAERLEAFLEVRRQVVHGDNDLAKHLAILDDRPDKQGQNPTKIQKIKAGVTLLPAIFNFAEERNRALLDAGMGLGEYVYIYTLSYFAFLAKDPADGPGFAVMDSDEQEQDKLHWEIGASSRDKEAIREKREQEVRDYLNKAGRAFLTNQLRSLDDAADLPPGLNPEVWRGQLAAEIELLENENLRFPWEEGLPGHIAAALEIYRSELEAGYDDLLSPLDIGMTEED